MAALKSLEPAKAVVSEELTFTPQQPKIEIKIPTELVTSALQSDSTALNRLQ